MNIFGAIGDMLLPGLGSALTGDGLFGGGRGSVGDALTGQNGLFSNPEGAWDNFKNGKTNDVNREIAEENLNYQRERNEIEDARYEEETAYNRAFAENERAYQRELQQQIFNREDTALERQASSLSSMGINPLSQQLNGLGAGQALTPSSAGGSSAGGSSYSSSAAPSASGRGGSALHNDFKMQDTGILGALTPLMSLFQGVSDLSTGNLTRDGLRAQNDYQRLVNQSQAIENAQKEIELRSKLENIQADTASKKSNTKTTDELREYEVKDKKASAERNQRENMFQETYGAHDLMNNTARLITDLAGISTSGKLEPDALEESTGKTSVGKKYLGAGKKALNQAYESVSKSLANTIGKGASAVFNYFTKPKKAKSSSQWKRAQDR